jgi:hypothetical protein
MQNRPFAQYADACDHPILRKRANTLLGDMKAVLRIILRIMLVGAVTLVLLFVGGIAAFWYLVPDLCGNEVIAEYPSPSTKHRVVVFERNCGATTGFSTQASILGIEEALENEGGNVFAADTDRGAAPSGPGGGPSLSVTWETEDSVAFSYHPKTRVFRKEPEIGGVKVIYSESAQQSAPIDAEAAAQPRRD